MNDLEFVLQHRRKRLASRSVITTYSDIDDNYAMTDYNSKVDLRPPSMIRTGNLQPGKPHIDAVLHPDQRKLGIPTQIPSFLDQIKNVKLSTTGRRQEIDAEGNRKIDDSVLTPIVTVIRKQHSIESDLSLRTANDGRIGINTSVIPPAPPPPPPPPPLYNAKRQRRDTDDSLYQVNQYNFRNNDYSEHLINDLNESQNINRSSFIEPRFINMDSAYNYYSNRQHEFKQPQADEKQSQQQQSTHENEFKERLLKDKQFKEWISDMVAEKFERESRIETVEPKMTKIEERKGQKKRVEKPNKLRVDESGKSRSRSRGRSTKRDSSKESITSRRTVKSVRSNTSSIRSMARSIKSVIFKGMQEEEIRSEISDEDVANIKDGEIGFIDYTTEKFTIHGPFVDRELNVFHAICREYELAAKMSFANRNPFSRTNHAPDRVYALLGSDRRSNWTNRTDWTKVTTELQVLDFIFRKTIRSKSKVIHKPVMELEFLKEGTHLDLRRFRRIIRSIYQKRDTLMESLGVQIRYFDEIK